MFVSQVPEKTVPFERSKSIDREREKGEETKIKIKTECEREK